MFKTILETSTCLWEIQLSFALEDEVYHGYDPGEKNPWAPDLGTEIGSDEPRPWGGLNLRNYHDNHDNHVDHDDGSHANCVKNARKFKTDKSSQESGEKSTFRCNYQDL